MTDTIESTDGKPNPTLQALEVVFELLHNGIFPGSQANKVAQSLAFIAALHENHAKEISNGE